MKPRFWKATLAGAFIGSTVFVLPSWAADTPPVSGKSAVPVAVQAEARQLLAKAPSAKDYPNAAKATLLDLADIVLRADGSSRTVTRQVVKIFNERGREAEGEVRIPYTQGMEKITILHARTIRPDGRIIEVKPGDILDQGYDEGDGSYSDARTKSFSMPAIENGSLIDYEYVTDQKSAQMPGRFYYAWSFQSGTDPVQISRLTVTAPKTLLLRQDTHNTPIQPVKKPTPDGKDIVYTWKMVDPTPLSPEPMADLSKVYPRLELSSVPTWQDVAGWYWGLAKDRMVADSDIKALTARLIKDKKTPEEKAKAIYYYVESETRYVAKELGVGAFQPHRAADTCSTKFGDCKDMATLLVAMLREAGINAHPVLLGVGGTRVKVSQELPSPGAFNHAICNAEINGKEYWLDATAQVCSWGQIPGSDRGVEALVIRDGKGTFETIPNADVSEMQISQQIDVTVAPDGGASAKVTMKGTGDVDMSLRNAFTYLPPDKQRPFIERFAQQIGPNARVTEYSVSDFRNKDLPVTIHYTVTFPSWAKKSGDLLLFKARPEQTEGSASSPFREDVRNLPITQNSAGSVVSTMTVTLPDGFTVLSAPDSADVRSELGHFQRTVNQNGNAMTITTRNETYRAVVPAAKYEVVRKYYLDYLSAADELAVIKRSKATNSTAPATPVAGTVTTAAGG